MKNLICFNGGCNWSGSYEEAYKLSDEEIETLKLILFRDKTFLKKEGYDNFKNLTGHICPVCKSLFVIDINKINKQGENSGKTFQEIAKELKLSKN
ncbi:MAG: hypothetical protein WC346_05755 [Methanogenium sp.]|jgi:hypothetical protein